jgi:hypothetical protein
MTTPRPAGIFRSAISDVDGMVDSGYLSFIIFSILTVVVVIGMLCGLTVQAIYDEHHKFDALQLGQAMGLAGVAFSGVATTVGIFRRLDRPATGTSSSTTTATSTATTGVAPQ